MTERLAPHLDSRVDVIVVTYGSAATLPACLASVRTCTPVCSLSVVDNASRDGSAELARTSGADAVVENDVNRGFAAAVNQALSHGAAEFVLLLNPDTVVEAATVGALVERLDTRPGTAIAAPALVDETGRVTLGARRFSSVRNRVSLYLPLVRRAARWVGPEYRDADTRLEIGGDLEVDYAWGAAMLVRRSFLESSGGLDSRFFLYGEDEDLCRQAWSRGQAVVLATSQRVRHVGAVSSQTEPVLNSARHLIAKGLLFEKWEGARAARRYHAALRLALTLQWFAYRLTGRPRAAAEARALLVLCSQPDAVARS